MAYRVNLYQLETQLNTLLKQMKDRAEKWARNTSFTSAGKVEKWATERANFFDQLQNLRGDINAARRGADNMIGHARASVVGTPPNPEKPDVGAELAVARILGRRSQWKMENFSEELKPILGTPTASLLIEELTARKLLDAELIDALIEQSSPLISTARQYQKFAYVALSNTIEPTLEELDELYDRGPLTPGANTPEGITLKARVSLRDMFGNGTAFVSEAGEYEFNTEKLGNSNDLA